VQALIDEIDPHLDPDETHVIRWLDDRDWGAVVIDLFTGLLDREFEVVLPSTEGVKYDPWRTAPRADNAIVGVTADDETYDAPADGSELIASCDPLEESERFEYARLWARIAAEAGPDIASSTSIVGSPFDFQRLRDAVADQSSADRSIDLWSRGSAYFVYLTPTPDTSN